MISAADAGLTDLKLGAIRSHGRLEGELGIVERVVDASGGEEWVVDHGQHLLHLTGAHVCLAFLQPVHVVGEEGQPGLILDPLAQPGEADLHQLRVEEGHGCAIFRHQAAPLPIAGSGILVEGVHGIGVAGIDIDLAHQRAGFLVELDELQQFLRVITQVTLVSRQSAGSMAVSWLQAASQSWGVGKMEARSQVCSSGTSLREGRVVVSVMV